MMKWMLTALFLLTASGFAQTSNDYFHNGAQSYIDSKLKEAIAAVERGLELDPANPKLQALLEKLKEEQKNQQQNQDQQQQNQEQEQNKDQQQNQQDQQDQEQKEDQQEQENRENQQEQDQQQNPEEQQQQQQQQMPNPQELSKEDAERILQALRSKEKENQKLKRIPVVGKKKVEKDW